MKAVVAVAGNTFRQVIRQRLFYNVVLFGIGMVAFAMVVGGLTFGFPDRVVRSIGLSGVVVALDLMAILVGVNLIHEEIAGRTLFVVLTRPVERWQYVLGRYLGLLLALITSWVGLVAVYFITLLLSHGSPTGGDLTAVCAAIPEAAVLAGIGVVISSFSTPTLGTGMAVGLWLATSTTDDLLLLTKDDPMMHSIAKVLYYVLPCLERFNFRESAVYNLPVTAAELSGALGYGVVYAAMLVSLAGLVLSRREMV